MKNRKLASLIYLFLLLFLLLTVSACERIDTEDKIGKEVANGVKIELGKRSEPFPGAKVKIVSPSHMEVIPEGEEVLVSVEVENYVLGVQTETQRATEIANSAKGQHVHVILDNKPYKAVYEAGVPFSLGVLQPGPHTIFAFPSRSYHESVKEPGASDVLQFYVKERSGSFKFSKIRPTLIYSRPKGKYEGEGSRKIMLDFYTNNVELGSDGYRAKYTISKKAEDGTDSDVYSIIVDKWNLAFVTGLSSGTYEVLLELLNKDGELVDGEYNSTKREITVIAE